MPILFLLANSSTGASSAAIELGELGTLELSLAAGLVLVAGVVSVAIGLRMEKRLLIASVRTVVQLLLVGYVLKEVFELDTWWAIAPIVVLMIAIASRAAVQRPSRCSS